MFDAEERSFSPARRYTRIRKTRRGKGPTLRAVDDDTALVRRLGDGDEEAFTLLVRRYHPTLVRLALGTVGNRAVAEEVAQDTWLAVVKGIRSFEGRSSFRTWLFHILMNRARSTGAREHRAAPLRDDDLAERFDAKGAWAAPPGAWADEVTDRLAAERLVPEARRLIDALPDAQRQVMLLRDVEGVEADDVCALLGLSGGNQRVLLHRARTAVRAGLAEVMG
jgi:RNA polymerase sigma-70 factor (ECF subfamily)